MWPWLPLLAFNPSPPSADSVSVVINPWKHVGSVNRLVLGHNVEAADPNGIFGTETDTYLTRTGNGIWDPEKRQPDPILTAAFRRVGTATLRYPGGCLAHGFRWKRTIGPVAGRPDFAFGLDEFLSFCRTVGAKPVITVSDYSSTPEDAAHLVEYLNAPASPKNSWAMRRARNGHPHPYGVVWFELGNESDHGNHNLNPRKTWTAKQYADWFLASVRAMKRVDPKIRCGVVLSTTFPNWNASWSDEVLRRTRSVADFAVAHCYSVGITTEKQAESIPLEWMLRAPLASIDAYDRNLADWRARVRAIAGRPLPIAVTEFNAMFLQENPAPLRFSLASALFSAGLALKMADPRSGVLLGNYWQFANGYWGMVHTRRPGGARRLPAYWAFTLLADGLLPSLNAAGGIGPPEEFRPPLPVGSTAPCYGSQAEADRVIGPNLFEARSFQASHSKFWSSFIRNGSYVLRLRDVAQESHVPIGEVFAPSGAELMIAFEGRFVGNSNHARLGVSAIDRRGWEPYHSGVAVEGLETAPSWKRFAVRFPTLPGSEGCLLAWRVIPQGEPVEGLLEIRELAVRIVRPAHQPAFPRVQFLACSNTGRRQGAILLLHRGVAVAQNVTVKVLGVRPIVVSARTLVGPLVASNLGTAEANIRHLPVSMRPKSNEVSLRLPPHSLTLMRYSWMEP